MSYSPLQHLQYVGLAVDVSTIKYLAFRRHVWSWWIRIFFCRFRRGKHTSTARNSYYSSSIEPNIFIESIGRSIRRITAACLTSIPGTFVRIIRSVKNPAGINSNYLGAQMGGIPGKDNAYARNLCLFGGRSTVGRRWGGFVTMMTARTALA